MKFLKYLLFTVLALVLIFFLIGFAKPAVNYGSKVTIDRPVEHVWAVSQDEDLYSEWLEGFQSMERLSGNYMEPGSTYRIIVNPGDGQEDFEMIETLVSIEENEHVEMHFDSEMMDFEQVMTFEEENGKTTVTTDSKVMGKGIFMRSMFATMEMLGGAFTQQEQKNMEALKALAERS
ncbi:MAG: SRPBCC family protein [Flavobacteriales bacterium]|nr:SRPBCC family protein [Flavobacteriales bacterium]